MLRRLLPIVVVASCSPTPPAVPITAEAARATALAHTFGAIVDTDLELEGDTWVWEIEVRSARRPGGPLVELKIDAHTGAIVSVEADWD